VVLKKGYEITPGIGSFAFSGSDVSLLKTSVIIPGVGTFAFTGTSADLLVTRLISIGTANFPFTGFDVTLSKTGAYELLVGSGAFPFTGFDAELTRTIIAAAAVIDEGHAYKMRKKRRIFKINEEQEIIQIIENILKSGMLD
jgi:hypothetical protein